MSRPKTIAYRRYEAVEGIALTLEYSTRAKNVEVIPDDDDLAAAGVYCVLVLWEWVALWAVKFRGDNPGWKVNGRTNDDEADPLAKLPSERLFHGGR